MKKIKLLLLGYFTIFNLTSIKVFAGGTASLCIPITVTNVPVVTSATTLCNSPIWAPSSGNVGIGTSPGALAPAFQLSVDKNINIINPIQNEAYRINSITVLQVFGINNTFTGQFAGIVNTGTDNTFTGFSAGRNNVLGIHNTFNGASSGRQNTGGIDNTFMGFFSGRLNTIGVRNTFIGSVAGEDNTLGTDNTFVGNRAGRHNTQGGTNTFIGKEAGQNNLTGSLNTFTGVRAGASNKTGFHNDFYGVRAGENNIDGEQNAFFGHVAGNENVHGTNNAYIGGHAGQQNEGSFNTFLGTIAGQGIVPPPFSSMSLINRCTFLGYHAGGLNTLGDRNTYVGFETTGSDNLSYAGSIGAHAIVTADNSFIIGAAVGAGPSPSPAMVSVGMGVSAPSNKLEINARFTTPVPSNPLYDSITNRSGLRFTQLTSSSPTLLSTNKVLSVNNVGDVILVQAAVTTGVNDGNNGTSLSTIAPNTIVLGQDTGQVTDPAQLLSHREIPMNNFNLFFTDPATQTGLANNRIQMGDYSSGPFPAAINSKFTCANTKGTLTSIGGTFTTHSILPTGIPLIANPYYFGNIGGQYRYGVVALAIDPTNNARCIGVSAFAYNMTSGGQNTVGVSGKAYGNNSSPKTGVGGVAMGSGPINVGIGGIAEGGNENYGVRASAAGLIVGAINYGIYAVAGPSSGATPPTGPNYAGYFDGDVIRTGTDNFTSDANLKQNIVPLNNVSSIINALNPKKFEFNQTVHPNMHLAFGQQYGLIAQDVEAILPELVSDIIHPATYDTTGAVAYPSFTYKSLNYNAFIPILLAAVKEQNDKIDSLENALGQCCNIGSRMAGPQENNNDALSQKVQDLEKQLKEVQNLLTPSNSSPGKSANNKSVELSNENAIVLNQNVPNPFAEKTSISYFIPEGTKLPAQIIFTDNSGKIIKSVEIEEVGNGTLTVYANNLSSGVYTYSIVVDGKTIDSKRMVCSK